MAGYTPKTFGAALSSLLNKYSMSAATVSRMLGHKSRTTLRRILTDQSNADSMEKFLQDFLKIPLLPLTDDEIAELRLSLDYSRMGPVGFRAQDEMRRLMNAPSRSGMDEISLRCIQTGEVFPLSSFLHELSRTAKVRMLIINCGTSALFDALSGFLTGTFHPDFAIDHYFFLNDNIARTAQFMADIYPMLCIHRYTAYAVPSPSPDRPPFYAMTASVIACRAERPDGSIYEYQIGFDSPLHAQLLCFIAPGVFEYWQSLIAPSVPVRISVKTSSLTSGTTLREYAALHSSYRELENNHDIYMLKPGLHPALIPPELLEEPFLDALRKSIFGSDPDFDALACQLYEIHVQRFRNIFTKKRVTHILIPPDSMQRFLKDGLLPDLGAAIRPLTVWERRTILTHCRDQARDNPYFNIYFLKGEMADIRLEATCYEQTGVLFHSCSRTDYFGGGHTDALVALDDFTALFSRFFRETLLPNHALSAGQSVAVLSSMLDALPSEEAAL
ncbi:MAG: hypothetical protein IJE08_16175 [Clostridia bacterium]|nr:hypothetical protein [Clostridia bacterium]